MNQLFALLARDDRLQLARGERVDVARFAGDEQQHLGARKRGQLVGLKSKRNKIGLIDLKSQSCPRKLRKITRPRDFTSKAD